MTTDEAVKKWRATPEADRQFVVRGLRNVAEVFRGSSSRTRAVAAAIDLLLAVAAS